MPNEKIIVIFIAGNPLSEADQTVLIERVQTDLQRLSAKVRLIQPKEWLTANSLNETVEDESETRVKLLTRQKAYMQSRRWPFSNDAIAAAFQDMCANAELGTLYFVYAFDQQKLLGAEAHADSLYVEWVPAKKYRRPALWILLAALLLLSIPVTLSLLFPNWLGAAWTIIDLAALWAAGTLIWRGSIKRWRKYPIHHKETCGGCGRTNRFTTVVTFNCEKCGADLAYELVKDPVERELRIQQVKCPHCNTSNDLRFRRTRYACQRCEVKQKSSLAITD